MTRHNAETLKFLDMKNLIQGLLALVVPLLLVKYIGVDCNEKVIVTATMCLIPFIVFSFKKLRDSIFWYTSVVTGVVLVAELEVAYMVTNNTVYVIPKYLFLIYVCAISLAWICTRIYSGKVKCFDEVPKIFLVSYTLFLSMFNFHLVSEFDIIPTVGIEAWLIAVVILVPVYNISLSN